MFSRLTEKGFWFRRESENFFFIEFTLLLQLLIYQNFFVFDFFMLRDVLLNRIQVVCILQVCRYHHYGFTLDDQRKFLVSSESILFSLGHWHHGKNGTTHLTVFVCRWSSNFIVEDFSFERCIFYAPHTVTYPCRCFFDFSSFLILQVYNSIEKLNFIKYHQN